MIGDDEMTDTALIIAHMDKRIAEMKEEILAALPKRAKPRQKCSPSYADVHAYAESRGRVDLAKKFYDYYTAGKDKSEQWKDGGDKPIYIWKNKFQYWESRNPLDQLGKGEIG